MNSIIEKAYEISKTGAPITNEVYLIDGTPTVQQEILSDNDPLFGILSSEDFTYKTNALLASVLFVGSTFGLISIFSGEGPIIEKVLFFGVFILMCGYGVASILENISIANGRELKKQMLREKIHNNIKGIKNRLLIESDKDIFLHEFFDDLKDASLFKEAMLSKETCKEDILFSLLEDRIKEVQARNKKKKKKMEDLIEKASGSSKEAC